MTGGDGSAVYDPVIEAGRCLPFATEHHLRARPLLAVLLSLGLAGGTLAASAQASPAAPDGRVRLTGDLVRTSVESAGSQPSFGVLVDGRLVPVAGDELTTTTGRSRVTVDVAVPQTVADAAAAGRTLHVPTTKGALATTCTARTSPRPPTPPPRRPTPTSPPRASTPPWLPAPSRSRSPTW